MNVPRGDIEALEKWLSPRIGALISQGEKVADVLRAAGGVGPTGAILQSAMQVVRAEGIANAALSPQQAAVWKTLLPILAEQSVMTVRAGGGHAAETDSGQQAGDLGDLLSSLGLTARAGGGPAKDEGKPPSKEEAAKTDKDRPLTKEEAAEFLGFSVRKLDRHMERRQVAYEKYGTGRTATVRFHRSELERFRESRKVSARGHGQQSSSPGT